MEIIGRKNIFLSISGIFVLASIASVAMFGLNLGIDFTGGSILEVEFEGRIPLAAEIREAVEPLAGGTVVQLTGERGALIRFRDASEEEHQAVLGALGNPEEKRFYSIGPVIGAELARKAVIALGIAILFIVLYIAWAFRRVSEPVSSWKYGIVAIVALLHDIIIPTGIFAFFGWWTGVQIDLFFVSALLTILGFSVHDTIVVFDRVRENLANLERPESYGVTVERSVNQTLVRSINTSFTTFLVLAAVFFLGGSTIAYFALVLLLGVLFGTYSSIFVASPLLVFWHQLTDKR